MKKFILLLIVFFINIEAHEKENSQNIPPVNFNFQFGAHLSLDSYFYSKVESWVFPIIQIFELEVPLTKKYYIYSRFSIQKYSGKSTSKLYMVKDHKLVQSEIVSYGKVTRSQSDFNFGIQLRKRIYKKSSLNLCSGLYFSDFEHNLMTMNGSTYFKEWGNGLHGIFTGIKWKRSLPYDKFYFVSAFHINISFVESDKIFISPSNIELSFGLCYNFFII